MSYRDDFFKNNKSNHGWYDCAYCGTKLRKNDVEVDHITPKARGGGNELSNLTASCTHCNRQKGSLDDVEYEIDRDLRKEEIEKRFERDEMKYGYTEAMRRELNRKTPYIK